jgi:hypothetical protein
MKKKTTNPPPKAQTIPIIAIKNKAINKMSIIKNIMLFFFVLEIKSLIIEISLFLIFSIILFLTEKNKKFYNLIYNYY